MSCLACGKVSNAELKVVKYYKELFNKKGIVFWAYRLSDNEQFSFVENSYFAKIRETQIEPNFINGAEYFHIQEFKA